MAYLLYFFLAFGTLFLAPWLGAERLAAGERWLAFAPLLIIVPHALALGVQRFQIRGRVRLALMGERALRLAPVYLQAAFMLGMGGLGLLQRLWPASMGELKPDSVAHWPEPALVLALLPYFLFQVLVIDARARLFGSGAGASRARNFQLRMFASTLVPFALISLVASALAWNQTWSVRFEEVELLGAGLGVAFLLLAMFSLPRLLTLVWSTRSLPAGELRARLEGIAQRAGLRFRDLMLWRTGGLMPNALIMGFSPGTRRVLLTDALLDMLSEQEVEAVFGHELGHAKGHHGLLLGAYALGALLGTEVLIDSLTPLIAESTAWDPAPVSFGLFLIALLVWGRGFGVYSRWLEMEADLMSLRSTGDLHAIVNTLFKVTAPQSTRRSSWRHPSTAKRVAFLLSVANDASIGERLQQRLQWMKRCALLLFFSALAYRAWGAGQNWDRDWLVADLRLGHYQEAQARLAGMDGTSESLDALVETAAGLGAAQAAPAEMLALALTSLQAGDPATSMQLLELASLRERGEQQAVLLALSRFLDGDPLEPAALPDAWMQALKALDQPNPAASGEARGSQ